ncbi:hypothetical protein [Pseudanabaena sp. 'Roaring Creek']|uniref:hypothetical protein n=1 Tax=Pseudanabaena sp. 'Roaring Creek' TaxID=1681830 RepID=UPI0012E0F730|nr:hypothetical protein [Pseudanabaena sp. 'Roaring Creek']
MTPVTIANLETNLAEILSFGLNSIMAAVLLGLSLTGYTTSRITVPLILMALMSQGFGRNMTTFAAGFYTTIYNVTDVFSMSVYRTNFMCVD